MQSNVTDNITDTEGGPSMDPSRGTSSSARELLDSLSRFRWQEPRKRGILANGSFKGAELVLRSLRDYHSHRVVGLEHLPRVGPALLVFTHSFATYDSMFFGVILYDHFGRWIHAMGDRLLMRLPVVGPTFRELGFIDASRTAAVDLLKQGEVLGVVPGGMREALRSSREKYRIDWRGRTGFVWASCLSGAPIILAACPRADDIFDVADLDLTRKVYQRFRMPLALFRGLGPTLLPRPVKLTHLLSEPIFPQLEPDRITPEYVEAHHSFLTERMNQLVSDALRLDSASAAP